MSILEYRFIYQVYHIICTMYTIVCWAGILKHIDIQFLSELCTCRRISSHNIRTVPTNSSLSSMHNNYYSAIHISCITYRIPGGFNPTFNSRSKNKPTLFFFKYSNNKPGTFLFYTTLRNSNISTLRKKSRMLSLLKITTYTDAFPDIPICCWVLTLDGCLG